MGPYKVQWSPREPHGALRTAPGRDGTLWSPAESYGARQNPMEPYRTLDFPIFKSLEMLRRSSFQQFETIQNFQALIFWNAQETAVPFLPRGAFFDM